MGHLEVWKIKFLAINKKINWYTDSFLYECTHAYLKLRAYLIIKKENIIQEEKDV
jgi:hypothetical protein